MTLVAFDFTGPLSSTDLSMVLAEEYGAGDEMSAQIESEDPETPIGERLAARVQLLEGMGEDAVTTAFDRASLHDGVVDMIGDLRASDVHVAVITAGFEDGVERILSNAGVAVDSIHGTELEYDQDALTGTVTGPLAGSDKGEIFGELVQAAGYDLGSTIAVGDSVTDIPMLTQAGTAIGFTPTPALEQYCDLVVTDIDRLQLFFEQKDIIDG